MGNINETNYNEECVQEYVKIISNFTYSKFLNQVGLQNSISIDSRIYLKKKERPVDSTALNKLGDSIGNLTNLRHISILLRDCSFNEESIKSFAIGLSKLTNLENLELEISSCELNVSQCITLVKYIGQMSWINQLTINFTKNDITNEGISQISNYLSKMTQLKELQLFFKGNHFNEKGANYLNDMLGNLHNLKIIFIDIESKFKQLQKTINEIERKNDTQCYLNLYDSGDDTS